MRTLAILAALCAATSAQAQAVLGTEAGCAHVAGDETAPEDRFAVLPGHLAYRGATCQIAGIQTGTLVAACAEDGERFDLVLGISRAPDGGGVVIALPDEGGERVLYPCE
ncbi:hypothetical protein ATO8_06731 [Roseivivax marinus]|uniref:Secreted protein n=1 Tax=Roseivivax marinus TaxID=1379903 RepID=W4HNW6_9RHOB|nr:hypothetical protein [Roseivivax marinus]ETW13705.1 hypothetical protein ATO8_06731 [Roseivivax marinus]